MANKKLKLIHLIVYIIVFYTLWMMRELLLRPIFDHNFSSIGFGLIETATKLIIWTLPAIWLIKIYNSDMWIGLKEMFTQKVKWTKYFLIVLGFLVYYMLIAFFMYGEIVIYSNFRIETLISSVLFVGITEEIVFRGWLLNSMLNKIKPRLAIGLNAVLFLAIHFPFWIYKEQFFNSSLMLKNCVVIIVLSIIFSITFIKSKNILVPILLHMCWNLFNILLIGG